MKHHGRAFRLGTCLALSSIGLCAQATEPPGAMLAEYQELLAGGCKVEDFRIHTPIEARILRNLPFAFAGRKLESPELEDLFQRGGDWYRPTAAGDVELTAEDRRCVGRLLRREQQLRRHWKVEPAIEHAVTRHPAVFLGLRRNASQGTEYRNVRAHAGENEWSILFEDAAGCGGSGTPDEAGDCSSVQILCERSGGPGDWKTLACEVTFAG